MTRWTKDISLAGMVHFLQLTVVQLGGEANMLANPGAQVNLAAIPLCCFAGFSWTKVASQKHYLVRGSRPVL